jgi:hypothetical protein
MFGLPISCENQPEVCAYQAQLFNTAVTSGLIQYDGSGNAFIIRNGTPVYAIPPVGATTVPLGTGGIKPIPPTPTALPVIGNTSCGCAVKPNGDCGCDHSIFDTIKEHPTAVVGGVLAVLYFLFGGK